MPADEPFNPIDHDDFTVVAKVDLEATDPAPACRESLCLNTASSQGFSITPGQGVAADAVVQQIHLYALGGFFQQQGM